MVSTLEQTANGKNVTGLDRTGELREILPYDMLEFRVRNIPITHSKLWYDEWEFDSEKYGYYLNGKLIGTFRIVREKDGTLPFSEYLPKVEVAPNDIELSRIVVNERYRRTRAVPHFFGEIAEMVMKNRHRIGKVYIDIITKNGINPESYAKFKFEPTGHSHWDTDYKCDDVLLVAEPSRVAERPKLERLVPAYMVA